jgi:predicted O-methyltransferase YrrM
MFVSLETIVPQAPCRLATASVPFSLLAPLLPSALFHRILECTSFIWGCGAAESMRPQAWGTAMSRSLLPAKVERYVTQEIARETPVQKRLRAETARLPQGGMQIGADQGALLALLVRSIGARMALEIGTFTGYSALAVATALPADGKLVCCDKSEEWTAIARRHWKDAGVGEKIELRLAPALETLAALEHEHGAGSFDFAFIDADKGAYDAYYEGCLRLLRPAAWWPSTTCSGEARSPIRKYTTPTRTRSARSTPRFATTSESTRACSLSGTA